MDSSGELKRISHRKLLSTVTPRGNSFDQDDHPTIGLITNIINTRHGAIAVFRNYLGKRTLLPIHKKIGSKYIICGSLLFTKT